MQKLSTKGFAHHVAIMAVVVVAVIGGIGSYIYLNSSSAATPTPASLCGKGFYVKGQKRLKYTNGTSAPAVLYVLAKANKGKVCSVVMSTGAAYGKSKHMATSISVWEAIRNNGQCAGGKFGPYTNSGTFKYYAGPKTTTYDTYKALNITNGWSMLCTRATGNMTYAGKSASARLDLNTWYF